MIPPRGVNALHRQISTLRRVLGRAEAVERRGRGYASPSTNRGRHLRFEGLAGRGREAMREADLARASALFDGALGLWRGDALVDVVDELFAEADRPAHRIEGRDGRGAHRR